MTHPGVRYGLLGGLVVVGYFLLLYVVNKTMFLDSGLQWGSLGIYGLFMYQAARQDCAQNGRNREFRTLVRVPFMAFLLINLCYWLFYYSLHLADPTLLQMETAAQLAYLKAQITAGTGDPQQANTLREQIAYLEQHGMSLPLGPVFMQMGLGALGGFAMASVVALIHRVD